MCFRFEMVEVFNRLSKSHSFVHIYLSINVFDIIVLFVFLCTSSILLLFKIGMSLQLFHAGGLKSILTEFIF